MYIVRLYNYQRHYIMSNLSCSQTQSLLLVTYFSLRDYDFPLLKLMEVAANQQVQKLKRKIIHPLIFFPHNSSSSFLYTINALKPFAKLHHYHHINYIEIGIFVVIPTQIISW